MAGVPIAMHYWADLQSVNGFHCYDNIAVYQSLVVALVLSRLDYGNATFAGLPTSLLNRLQSVINAAARSIAGLRLSLIHI